MRRLALVALVALVACSRHGATKTVSADGIELGFTIQPDPPIAADNELDVDVRDTSGAPIDDAKVSLVYDMPAMGAMPEMKGGGTTVGAGQGRYRITYPLAMNGDWTLIVTVTAPGHAPIEQRLEVSPPRPGFTIESSAPSSAMPMRSGEERAPGVGRELVVPPQRQQLIGVTFANVEARPMSLTVRAPGVVTVDERSVDDVTLQFDGYVRRLLVNETGRSVRAGQALAEVYSPDVLAAEEELLQARRAGSDALAKAARRKLELWSIPPAQLAETEKRGKADGLVTVVAPTSGVVLEKGVVEGTRVMPGAVLYRVGSLGRVWVQAQLHELDAPRARVGERARVSIPSLGGEPVAARITFVAPTIDERSRTLAARLELDNPALTLKPGMYVDVDVDVPLGTRLAVPDRALLYSGEHRYAFVDRGDGRLLPVEVRIGAQADGFDEVRSGLTAGERIVLGSNFLVGSEAQLRDALPRWETP